MDELVGRRGDTGMGADDELLPLLLLPRHRASPLLPEIRWKAAPFLDTQREGVTSPQSSLFCLPWGAEMGETKTTHSIFSGDLHLHTAKGPSSQSRKQKTASDTSSPHSSSLLPPSPLPAEHFPAATGEGRPSSLDSLPSPAWGAGARREPTEPGEVFLEQKPQDTRECTSDH